MARDPEGARSAVRAADRPKGARGGYLLARPAGEIILLDVARAVGEDLDLVDCLAHPATCPWVEGCPTRSVWGEVGEKVRATWQATTLDDLLRMDGRPSAS